MASAKVFCDGLSAGNRPRSCHFDLPAEGRLYFYVPDCTFEGPVRLEQHQAATIDFRLIFRILKVLPISPNSFRLLLKTAVACHMTFVPSGHLVGELRNGSLYWLCRKHSLRSHKNDRIYQEKKNVRTIYAMRTNTWLQQLFPKSRAPGSGQQGC